MEQRGERRVDEERAIQKGRTSRLRFESIYASMNFRTPSSHETYSCGESTNTNVRQSLLMRSSAGERGRTHPNLLAPLELNDGVSKGLVETSSLNEELEVLLDGRVEVVESCVRWGCVCLPSAPESTAEINPYSATTHRVHRRALPASQQPPPTCPTRACRPCSRGRPRW